MEDADQIHNFRIARWLERLVAYLIDSLITGVIIGTIFFSVLGDTIGELGEADPDIFGIEFGASATLLFVYLTAMEYFTGTTLGRRVFRLKVIDMDGKKPGLKGLLISNAGKSFILILDMILGRIMAHSHRQRICARLGGVIVVKAPRDSEPEPKYELD